jgi:hypothetical protein
LAFRGRRVLVRREGEPADGDIAIGPGGDDAWEDTEDEVVVVMKDGVSADLDGEEGGKEL